MLLAFAASLARSEYTEVHVELLLLQFAINGFRLPRTVRIDYIFLHYEIDEHRLSRPSYLFSNTKSANSNILNIIILKWLRFAWQPLQRQRENTQTSMRIDLIGAQ